MSSESLSQHRCDETTRRCAAPPVLARAAGVEWDTSHMRDVIRVYMKDPHALHSPWRWLDAVSSAAETAGHDSAVGGNNRKSFCPSVERSRRQTSVSSQGASYD